MGLLINKSLQLSFFLKNLKLELYDDNYQGLVEHHGQKLTTEQLIDIHCEQQH